MKRTALLSASWTILGLLWVSCGKQADTTSAAASDPGLATNGTVEVTVQLVEIPVDFAAHVASLKGERVLDRIRHEPEATLADWTNRWEDIGNPLQWNKPWETSWLGTKGHLVGTVAQHGSLYKFGVDRWASVRPDFASPHKFRFDPLWPGCRWTGQRLVSGQ